MARDALHTISASGGSDIYTAGTYKVSDGTLKSPVLALTVVEAATVSALMENRYSKTLKKFANVAYTPRFLNQSLAAFSEYFFEFPIHEITITGGTVTLHHVPTGRNADFTTTIPGTTTTTLPLTTV
jgi:hypothetical protein